MTLGKILLLGGLGGLVLFTLIGLIAWKIQRRRGEKLLRAIRDEYT